MADTVYQNNEQFYENIIEEVVSLGGDTDTNACIVGGLLGAYGGIKCINKNMLSKLFDFDC